MSLSDLYEPLIDRNVAAIPAAVRRFRETNGSEELFLAVARFAVLAFAPSEHSKHALLAVLAAHDLKEDLGERWDDLLTECARYIAASRQPWSEPPLMNPPEIDREETRDLEALRAVIARGDRLAGERWLAARLDDPQLERELVAAASDSFDDFGSNLIVTAGVLRLSRILGLQGRFAVLRVAVWQLIAAGAGTEASAPDVHDPEPLLAQLIAAAVAERGSLESMHRLFLFDAAIETGAARALSHLASEPVARVSPPALSNPASPGVARVSSPALRESPPVPIYPLARDYAQALIARAVAKRLAARFPSADVNALIAAADDNRLHGESFEDFSFA